MIASARCARCAGYDELSASLERAEREARRLRETNELARGTAADMIEAREIEHAELELARERIAELETEVGRPRAREGITVEEKAAIDTALDWARSCCTVAMGPGDWMSKDWPPTSLLGDLQRVALRRELTAYTIDREGHEPIGPTYHLAAGATACLMGPRGGKWIDITHDARGSWGVRVSAQYGESEAREAAALLINMADQIAADRLSAKDGTS